MKNLSQNILLFTVIPANAGIQDIIKMDSRVRGNDSQGGFAPIRYRGITLLELLLSLAIIAILLVMATRYFQVTQSAEQVNDGYRMVQQVVAAADNWYVTYKSYQNTTNGDISIEKLADMNLVPKNFVNQSVNPWGGAVAIDPKDSNNVTIQLTRVPTAQCLNLQDIVNKQGWQAFCLPRGGAFIMTYPGD